MDNDQFDRDIAQRLRAYEARIPDGEVPNPDVRPRRSRWGWPVVALGGLAAVAATVLVAAAVLNLPGPPVGDTSHTPVPSGSTGPTDSIGPSGSHGETLAHSSTPAPTPAPPPAGVVWREVGHFSADGVTESPTDIVVGADVVVAVGFALLEGQAEPDTPAPREGRVWISQDGLTWEAIVDPVVFGGAFLTDVAVAPDGTFLAYGHIEDARTDVVPSAAWRSDDGRSWSRIDSGLPDDFSPLGVTAGPKGFVAYGERLRHSQVWYSSNGVNWELALDYPSSHYPENPDGRFVDRLYAGAEGFVGHGSCQGSHLCFIASGDGHEWIDAPTQSSVQSMPSVPNVAAVGGDWIAASHGQPLTLWSSSNGLDWTEIEGVMSVGGTLDKASWIGSASGRVFIEAAGAFVTGPTWASDDEVAWTLTNLPVDFVPGAVADWHGHLIIAGSQYTGVQTETSFWVSDIR